MVSLLLLTSMVGVVMAATQTSTASVTVNQIIDTSISTTALTYTAGNPGDEVEVTDQGVGNPALTVTVNPPTNVDVDVETSGTAYSGPGTATIAVGQTEYCVDDYACITRPTLGTSLALIEQIIVDGNAQTTDMWYWLNIPSGFVPAGTYESTYTFDISS